MAFTLKFMTRWSDFDANRHMRHTAYNDYAAEARLRYFKEKGFDLENFEKYNIGPVLFAENTIFKKEIKLGSDISVKSFLKAVSEKGERCKIYHQIIDENDKLSAEITVYLAWIDLSKRKLTMPPKDVLEVLLALEKTADFSLIE
ncbi:MAG TPA: thioesterase [Flavobacteriia bacterium]|nr:thioesterase [Flavobacteriia bacterium]